MQQTSSGGPDRRSLFFPDVRQRTEYLDAPPGDRLESGAKSPAFASRIIEACWLAAVALVPLVYDPHGFDAFDAFKMAALRVIGGIALAAMLVRVLHATRDAGVPALPSIRNIPAWAAAVSALVLAIGLSTAFSIDRGQSFWGSTLWRQGAFTWICLLSLLVAVATHLRTRGQLDRLVQTALAASVPVSLYALIQRMGLDSAAFHDETNTAFSFLGHPIFLAGYLLMLMPVAAWRLWELLRAGEKGMSTWLCAFVLLLQVAAFVSADKRGPMVAVVLMSVFGLLLAAATFRRFRWIGWALGTAAVAGSTLVLFAWMGKMDFLQSTVPVLGKLTRIVRIGTGTGDDFRDSLWAAAPGVVLSAKPLAYPGGAVDRLHWLRPAVGYGPETLEEQLPAHWLMNTYGPEPIPESRFHNNFWGTWQATGWLGVVAFWGLIAAIFNAGFRSLGLGGGRWLAVAAFGAAIVGGGLLSAIYGAGYFGLGFQISFAAGLVTWAIWAAIRGNARPHEMEPGTPLVIALLAALLGNQVDAGFAFLTGGTAMLFCVWSGAVVAMSGSAWSANRPVAADILTWRPAALCTGLLTGAMLIVILHGFISLQFQGTLNFWGVLRITLTHGKFHAGGNYATLSLLFLAWTVMNLLILEGFGIRRGREWPKAIALAGALSLLLAVGFAMAKASWLTSLGNVPKDAQSLMQALVQASCFGALGILLLGFLAATILGMAALMSPRIEWSASGVCIGVAAVAVLGTVTSQMIIGEVFSKWGRVLYEEGRYALAAEVFETGLKMESRDAPSRIVGAMAWMSAAEEEKGNEAFLQKASRAAAILNFTTPRNELNFANYYLGDVFMRTGLRLTDTAARTNCGLMAVDAFQRAAVYAPGAEAIWVDCSIAQQELLHDDFATRKSLRTADKLARHSYRTLAGDCYAKKSGAASDATLKKRYAQRAVVLLQAGLRQDLKRLRESDVSRVERAQLLDFTFRTRITLGGLNQNLGDSAAALSLWHEAESTGSAEEKWEAAALLAQLYAKLGRKAEAYAELGKASSNAPDAAREVLQKLKGQIAQQKEEEIHDPL